MNTAYENVIGNAGASNITHIGLVDDTGTELSGGSYTRLAVTWTPSGDGTDPAGTIRPSADLTFDVPAGATVAEWRGYSALTAGVDYGGALLTNEVFANAGTYTLEAANTTVSHNAQ